MGEPFITLTVIQEAYIYFLVIQLTLMLLIGLVVIPNWKLANKLGEVSILLNKMSKQKMSTEENIRILYKIPRPQERQGYEVHNAQDFGNQRPPFFTSSPNATPATTWKCLNTPLKKQTCVNTTRHHHQPSQQLRAKSFESSEKYKKCEDANPYANIDSASEQGYDTVC